MEENIKENEQKMCFLAISGPNMIIKVEGVRLLLRGDKEGWKSRRWKTAWEGEILVTDDSTECLQHRKILINLFPLSLILINMLPKFPDNLSYFPFGIWIVTLINFKIHRRFRPNWQLQVAFYNHFKSFTSLSFRCSV